MELLVGLGGNLGDVVAAFAAARLALEARFRPLAASGLWRSAPVGPDQPDFLNAALLLDADVHPLQALALCQLLEARLGRDRGAEARWGPRRIDLDLLAAGPLVMESAPLALPHPRLAERRFALLPAAEAAPRWRHPRLQRTAAELAAALDPLAQPCERLDGW